MVKSECVFMRVNVFKDYCSKVPGFQVIIYHKVTRWKKGLSIPGTCDFYDRSAVDGQQSAVLNLEFGDWNLEFTY